MIEKSLLEVTMKLGESHEFIVNQYATLRHFRKNSIVAKYNSAGSVCANVMYFTEIKKDSYYL